MMSLLLPLAHAFCGTYVGPVGSAVDNHVSQVVLARDGDDVVLTLQADVSGDSPSFALVIPVPEALTESDVWLATPSLFSALDAYTAPRIVSYTCDDLYGYYGGGNGGGDDTSSDGGGYDPATGVTVESTFTVGSYVIAVLSATGADGLVDWLDANGFALGADAAPVVQEYIDAGQHFVAARVDLTSDPTSAAFLEPLQLRYTSPAWSLPIRIGTLNSAGEQDVVIYALAAQRVAISNYPEATLENDCLLPEGIADYATFYEGQLADAFADGIWFTEYAWSPAGCDPCSSEPVSEELLADAGSPFGWAGTVTRLRLRYSPAEATQDLSLYEGAGSWDQVRYITWASELESDFPTCGLGYPADAGSCDDPWGGGDDSANASDTGDGEGGGGGKADGCACGTDASGDGVAWLLIAAGLLYRRRSPRSSSPAPPSHSR